MAHKRASTALDDDLARFYVLVRKTSASFYGKDGEDAWGSETRTWCAYSMGYMYGALCRMLPEETRVAAWKEFEDNGFTLFKADN